MVNTIKTISNNNLCLIIYPTGKLDKKTEGYKDYKGQKGDTTCFLYSLKIATLYKNIIENVESTNNFRNFKKNSIANSEIVWRRQTTLNYIQAIATPFPLGTSEKSKNFIKEITPRVIQAIKISKTLKEGTTEVAEKLLQSFQESTFLNIFDYTTFLKTNDRIKEVRNYLTHEQIDLDNRVKEKDSYYMKLQVMDKQRVNSPGHIYHVLHEIFIEHVCTLSGFTYANWTPTSPIEDLILILKEHGAVLASALMGKNHSEIEPTCLLEKWNDYTVYGWKSGSFIQKKGLDSHTLVVVGAKKAPKELVYWIDPADASSIGQPRRVYVTSYTMFCDKASHKSGLVANGVTIKPEIAEYLLYKP